MLRFILLTLLTGVTIMGIVLDNSNDNSDKVFKTNIMALPDDTREDYGCVHDDHSQYDDGDSLNLEAVNSLY